jgi:hypothetical protein
MTRTAKPRLTARQRRLVASVDNMTADPEAEQAALSCLVWAFRDYPDAVGGMLEQLRPQLFTIDGAGELLEAAGLAAGADGLNAAGLVGSLRAVHEHDKTIHETAPATALFDPANAHVGINNANRSALDAHFNWAIGKIQKAFDNRQRAERVAAEAKELNIPLGLTTVARPPAPKLPRGLPVIRLASYPPGGVLTEPGQRAALTFVGWLPPEYAGRLRNVRGEDGRLFATLANGLELRIGPPTRLAEKAQALVAVLSQADPEALAAAAYLDISNPGRPMLGAKVVPLTDEGGTSTTGDGTGTTGSATGGTGTTIDP